MPALKNVRYEKFCQHIATSPKTGWPQGRCYTEAGFKTADRSADSCAARMLTRANIQARIAELVEPTVRKTRATVDSLASQFDRVFDGALSAEQFGAAGNAAGLKAKLLGFMREKIEIGSPSDFAACDTVEQVLDKMLGEQSPAEALMQLDELRGLLEQRAANQATVIDAPPSVPSPGS
jgi:hypothetical protein